MTRMLILFAFAASVGLAQKGKIMLPPDIAPRGFTHPDALEDPAHFHRQFENDHTRVLHIRLAPDEASKLYDAPDGVFVCFRECHVRLVDPAGHDQDIHLEDGETRWAWAGTRRLKNLSTHPVDMLFVEFRASS